MIEIYNKKTMVRGFYTTKTAKWLVGSGRCAYVEKEVEQEAEKETVVLEEEPEENVAIQKKQKPKKSKQCEPGLDSCS